MNYSEAIQHALNGQSMVFLGAGFSGDAINISGENLPKATDLAHKLCQLAEENKTDDLYTASELYECAKGADSLITYLTETYTIKDTCEHQDILANVPWFSVYTTNYDDVYSTSCKKMGKLCKQVTLSNSPVGLPPATHKIVYINGSISSLSRETIHKEFKLTLTGYANANNITSSPWCDEFVDDIRLAKSIFFVGYSMYDLDIQRIFASGDTIKHKCFFILDEIIDRKTKLLVDTFGFNTNKSVKDFSKDVFEAQKTFVHSNPEFVFRSFQKVDSDTCKKPEDELSKLVFDTYALGHKNSYDIARALESKSSTACYVFRKDLEDFIGKFESNSSKNSIYISDFGNGKTFFLHGVISYAILHSIPCYIFKENTEKTIEEIRKIYSNAEKQIVIFENFERHISVISKFEQYRTCKTYFILTSRTNFAETYFEKLPGTVKDGIIVNEINTLNDSELKSVIKTFEDNGLWGAHASKSEVAKLRHIKEKDGACFSRILLDILNSKTIREKIGGFCSEAEKSKDLFMILLAMTVFSKLDFSLSLQQIIRYIGVKVNNIITITTNPILKQICHFSDTDVSIKSSILANNMLEEHLPGDQIVNILIKIYESSTRMEDRHNRAIQHALDRFSVIQSLLPASKKLENSIRYFDSIMNMNGNARNYHFWLQYAITLTVFDRFSEASTRFQTAYSFLNAKKDDTFQIDNHYARFLLRRAIEDKKYSEYVYFREANTIVMRQVHMEKTLHFPYRPASLYEKYYEKYGRNLTVEEREHFIKQCECILSITSKHIGDKNIHKSIADCHDTMNILIKKLTV